jgi:hypothetical protein
MLGIVAGAIVGLLVLIKLYKYLKSKVPKKDPAKQRLTRTRAKSPKPAKVSKKNAKSDKEEKKKVQSKQEVYLQIEVN